MFGALGLPELLIIFFVILLLFGAKRLPELAAGLGKGLREFKKAANDVKEELEDATRLDEKENDKKKKE
jgi:sec-independent protein translocase protein TatA